jgi:hypothetical protein
MNAKRKIQFGAAAVVANGLLALTALSPSTALANPCTDIGLCLATCATPSICNQVAPAGCHETSLTCAGLHCLPGTGFVLSVCHFA